MSLRRIAEERNMAMDERRRDHRMDFELEATSKALQGGEEASVRSSNMSLSGAYFVTKSPPKVRELLMIKTGNALEMVGEVLRVDRHSDEFFGFAIHFLGADENGFSQAGQSPRLDNPNGNGKEVPVLFQGWNFELKRINEAAFDYYQRLARVHAFVTENYWQNISLEAVAEVAAMEKTYFSAFFHEKVGVPFSSWLQYLRISKALGFMSTGDYSITEVATRVGFDNLTTFRRTFKKWTNLTPAVFKKMARPC